MAIPIPVRVASLGPADNGKSTLFGYIVLNHIDSGSYWREVTKKSWFKPDRGYTYIFDRLQVEREGQIHADGKIRDRGTSRVATHAGCEIKGQNFVFIDCPGHEKFISNANAGIFQAQSGILVIAAQDLKKVIETFKFKEKHPAKGFGKKGVSQAKITNVLFCPILARVYGFDNLVIVISKMDQVEFDCSYFELAKTELLPRLIMYSGLNKDRISLIPASIIANEKRDINVITSIPLGHAMSWYGGPTVLEALTRIRPLDAAKGSLLIPVETVYLKKVSSVPLIITGRILRGKISVKQTVKVIPLYDRPHETGSPKIIEGRVRNIRTRDQSNQLLPWIGEFESSSKPHEGTFEAGHIVGLNLHLSQKYSWAKEHDRYFKKGCIVTEPDVEVLTGFVVRVEVFVPILSRPISPTEAWVGYLFGKNIGEALVLSSEMLELYADEDGQGYAGFFAEVYLLLGSRVAHPASNGHLDEFPKIVLRHHESCCGGRVLEIASADRIEILWDNESLNLDLKDVRGKLENSSKKKELRCKWHMVDESSKTALSVTAPAPSDIKQFYHILNGIIADFSPVSIKVTTKRDVC